jgi:chemotaxis protein methyltransferase CheR
MAAKQSEQRGAKGRSAAAGVKLGPALTLANAGEVAEGLRAALAGDGKVTLVIGPTASPDEIVRMIDEVTTNKTDFVREPAHFDFLVRRARR